MTAAERREIAGILRYAAEHYAQEAAAIYLLPRSGDKLNSVERRMIEDRVALGRRANELAERASTR